VLQHTSLSCYDDLTSTGCVSILTGQKSIIMQKTANDFDER
jgi:hypothetical protein